jgi:hypothetical protein
MLAVRTPGAPQATCCIAACDSAFPLERQGRLLRSRSISGLSSRSLRSGLQPPCLRFAAAVTGHHARLGTRLLARLCRGRHLRRLSSTRLQGATPTPPGIRVTYHGGSTGLSRDRDMESGETEGVEVVVAQGLLDRRVSRHAPEPGRRTGGYRCIELGYATPAQFVEAVVPVLPLPPKIRA